MTSRTTNHVSSPSWVPAGRGLPLALASRVSSWVEELWRRRAHARVERTSRSWRLRDGDTLLLRPGRHGLVLRCHSGTLLVTQEGDRLDHVLGPRDQFQTAERGSVAVWALSAGELGADALPVQTQVEWNR
jgi:hypothetical protein